MDVKHYTGKLKKWSVERGFGFVVAADAGQEIVVHISAFSRDGLVPMEGESLTFEVEPDRNGKRSAVLWPLCQPGGPPWRRGAQRFSARSTRHAECW
jgi:cold shock CspA family protein